MNRIELLIVEDEQDVLDLYELDIKRISRELFCEINTTIEKDLDGALKVLNDRNANISAAIVDLKLANDTKAFQEFSGNRVVEHIKKSMRFPVFVISSTPEQIDSDFNNKGPLFQVIKRGERDSPVEDLVKLCLKGITKILGYDGLFEQYLNEIFWNHLSHTIENWPSDAKQEELNEKSIFRYVLSLMHEYIDESVEHYHAAEFYIQPAIKASLSTGDIVNFNEKRYLILTPACDIAVRVIDGKPGFKADHVLFCQIEELGDVFELFDTLSMESSKGKKKDFKRYLDNSYPRYHFMPNTLAIRPGLVDFQQKITLPKVDVVKFFADGLISRDASVAVHFLKDIVSRYSSYYSRQGSPDFDTDDVFKSLVNSL